MHKPSLISVKNLEKIAEIQLDFVRFTLIRRATRRTVALKVKSDNSVIVLAPYFSSTASVISFVTQNKEWVVQRLTHNALNQIDTSTLYRPGAPIAYLGNTYPLAIGSKKQITIKDGLCLIPDEPPELIQKRLEKWYKLRAADIFLDRITLYEPKVGEQHGAFRLSSAKTRWGSCSTSGTISLRWTLIMAPISVIDYVVVHELCHLVHMNHSRAFWKLVKSIDPDMREAVQWLKTNGHTLTLPKP